MMDLLQSSDPHATVALMNHGRHCGPPEDDKLEFPSYIRKAQQCVHDMLMLTTRGHCGAYVLYYRPASQDLAPILRSMNKTLLIKHL